MKKILHQCYGIFNDGIKLTDIPIYKQNVDETFDFCEKHNYEYKLWSLYDCEKLIEEDFPEYKQLWKEYIYPIQRADFIRYCILYKFGGIYVDCDIRPMKNLDNVFNEPIYFVYWANDKNKKPYNAILASHQNNKLMLEIIKQCKIDFYEKKQIKIYKTWKGRFIFQTTGHAMLDRVIKKNNIDKDKYFHDDIYIRNFDKGFDIGNCDTALFYDANASVWYDSLI